MLKVFSSPRSAKFSVLCTATLALLFTAAGCALFGGGEPSRQRAGHWRITAPTPWRETDRGEGDRAWHTKERSLATVTSSCGRSSDASLEILTRHLFFGLRDVKTSLRDKWSAGNVEVLHTSASAKLEGKGYRLETAILKVSGCVFDFTLMGSNEFTANELREFRALVESFRYGKD